MTVTINLFILCSLFLQARVYCLRMGKRLAQIRKNAREREAAILKRHVGRILHRGGNSEADCAETKEHEVRFGGDKKNTAVDRRPSSTLKSDPYLSAWARKHDSVLFRAPLCPGPKHPHTGSPVPRQLFQSSQGNSLSRLAESTIMSQSDEEDSKTYEKEEEQFTETPNIVPGLHCQMKAKKGAEVLATDGVEKEFEHDAKDSETKTEGISSEVLDLIDTETKNTFSFRKHGCRDPGAVALNSEVGSMAVLQRTVLDDIASKQASLLGLRYDPLRYGRIKSSTAAAGGSRGKGGRARRNEQQSGTAWIQPSYKYDNELEGEDSGDEDYIQKEEEAEDEEDEMTAQVRLTHCLRALPADFFTSAEARMDMDLSQSSLAATALEELGVEDGLCDPFDGSRRRCIKYESLPLRQDPENCPDLLYAYEQIFEIPIRRGGKKDTYRQFQAAVGQLARFAVAAKVVEPENFALPGGLFQLAKDSKLIRAFMGGFQLRAAPSTVYSKAVLLVRFCALSTQHFGKIECANTVPVLSAIAETKNLLGGFARVEKATSRRQTAGLRDQNQRLTFVNESDWDILQHSINEDMDAVTVGLGEMLQQFGGNMGSFLDENHTFVRKFSLLLLIFVVLNGGGQRPQAYASMRHPTERTLKRWEAEWDSRGSIDGNLETVFEELEPVKLYPAQEKTARATLQPAIMFPDNARSYFCKYAYYIRPAIMRWVGKESTDLLQRNRAFLVHTEKGGALSVENLRSTLRTYVSGVKGLSGRVDRLSVMTLRASYASKMFQAFRRGEFGNITIEEFMSELAEIMNTSPEMLRTTYIATNGKEFDAAARAFIRAARAHEGN
jgi:hypothetical protein